MFKTIEDLFDWRVSRVDRMIRDQAPVLMEICKALGVQVYGNTGGSVPAKMCEGISSRCQGLYHPQHDSIGIFPHQILLAGHDTLNGVLAHEIIHSTAAYSRLRRGAIGLMMNHTSVDEMQHEEVVAQYGALVLLKKLGLWTMAEERHTEGYIKRVGKEPSGQPNDRDRLEAIRAVTYVLKELQRYQWEVERAKRTAQVC